MHSNTSVALLSLLFFITPASRVFAVEQAATRPSLVPWPVDLEMSAATSKVFRLNAKSRIIVTDQRLLPVATYLAQHLSPATGWPIGAVMLTDDKAKVLDGDVIFVQPNGKRFYGAEGYELRVDATHVFIRADEPAGFFYAAQSFRQLLPPQIESVDGVDWVVPLLTIRDRPRYPHRGFMLDSGRHMQTIDFIKRTLDRMAYYKLNRFHWHLTEDQGWRIEIKKYPKLTEIGAWRDETMGDGKKYGGFYTQAQIRDVVAYARERFIEVIPEIDMPGHMSAAVAAYPQLVCFPDREYHVQTKWGVFDDVLCPGKAFTIKFIEDVLTEVMQLFPGTVIHIGGDECPRTRWKQCPDCQALMRQVKLKNEDAIQNYFTRHVMSFLHDHGRRLQGWNEITHGGDLPKDVIVHEWNDWPAAIAAARAGNDVVISDTKFCYFDYPWEVTPMLKAYALQPTPAELSPDESRHILGPQANLWTENRPTDESCDEFIWPRLAALAEVAWSSKESRNADDFTARMKQSHYRRLATMGLGAAATTRPARELERELQARGDIEAKK